MTILDTPDKIEAFRLASVRAQLRLESKGLKSSGGALRPRLAKQLGLNQRDSHERFIEVCTARIDALVAKIQADNAASSHE